MQEIKELLGICENNDPTDKDRANLKKLVRELKSRNDIMVKEIKTLERVVEQLKEGRYSELESGKTMTNEEIHRLRIQKDENERIIDELTRENTRVKGEYERVTQYQSAY